MQRRVYFVGTETEVAHQAAPLRQVASFETQIIDANRVVESAERGDLAIFFSEHFDRFRHAIAQLKQRQIPTIYLVDGILEWRNAWDNRHDEPACPFAMRPVLCDKVAVIGPSQARILASWGNEKKVEVVGIPRLQELQSKFHQSQRQPRASGPLRVLVASAKTPGFTDEQIETTIRSLRSLKQHFGANEDTIRATWRLTRGLENEIGVENSLSDLGGGELHEAIGHCDAFITTPSTSMLESMLLRKPTALLNYHCGPCYVPAAWTIHSDDSMAAVLAQLANPTEEHWLFQNGVLADALQLAEPPTDRLVQLIHSMLAAAEPQQQRANSLEFEANLLPAPVFASHLSAADCKMDFAAVYANYPEFSDCEIQEIELRARLAHARREIDHRQRIEDGLRAELAEAHSIFEQIHQHPIAGPIVRLRERFIEFINRNR